MNLYILPTEYSGDPLATAMLQAFYSRSLEPIQTRLQRLGGDMTRVKAALNTFYIGYGHASIGDCGFVTVFIEGVSIIAAKEVQDDPLYNGQECSTRYIELSGDGYDPDNVLARNWQAQYQKIKDALIPAIRIHHPFDAPADFDVTNAEHTKPRSPYATWLNATAARAFDIARAWIPCNALTNLSLTCSLRTANELSLRLLASDLPEVVTLGKNLKALFLERYPEACGVNQERDEVHANWTRALTTDANAAYWQPTNDAMIAWTTTPEHHEVHTDVASGFNEDVAIALSSRPRHAKIPGWLDPYVTFTVKGTIDYGTWRDLQRHRRNIGRAPVLDVCWLHSWYTTELQRYLGETEAYKFINAAEDLMSLYADEQSMGTGSPERRYGLPLGTTVQYHYTMGLAQAIYFAELRSGNTVHAILRPMAQQVAAAISAIGIRIDYDAEPARFDVRRGTQTIIENKETS